MILLFFNYFALMVMTLKHVERAIDQLRLSIIKVH
jgi:hypothetical protein